MSNFASRFPLGCHIENPQEACREELAPRMRPRGSEPQSLTLQAFALCARVEVRLQKPSSLSGVPGPLGSLWIDFQLCM